VVDPGDSLTVYAGTLLNNGLYKSTNGGASWTPSNNGFPDNREILSLAIDPATPSTLYAGIHYPGCDEEGHNCYEHWSVYKSVTGGGTWSGSGAGLPDVATVALVIDPAAPSTLYAGTYNSGIYKSDNGGGSWIAAGLNSSKLQALAIDPTTPSTVYAGVFSQPSNAFVTKISP
jgi:hypothetical protein